MTWRELAELSRRHLAPHRFQRALFERIRDRPLGVTPADDPWPMGWRLWERTFLGPFPEAVDARARTFHSDVLVHYTYALRESRRVGAILARHYLRYPHEDSEEKARARRAVVSWIREVVRLSEDRGNTYFESYRVSAGSVAGDPYVAEVMSFLLLSDGRMAPPFCDPTSRPALAPIAEWLKRRYALRELSSLVAAWRSCAKEDDRPYALTRIHALLPRVAAATALGHFALGSQGDWWRAGARLVMQSPCPLWPMLLALAPPAVYAWLVHTDVLRHSPAHGYVSAVVLRIVAVSVVVSSLLAVALTCFAWKLVLAAEPKFQEFHLGHAILLGALQASFALALGYLLELVWTDKAVTEPL